MPTRRFERIALAQPLAGGCAVVFGACVLIQHAQAQQQVAPPPPPPAPPPPPPVFNPSPSNTTVPQPSYKSISPTTPGVVPGSEVTSPVNEEPPSTTARSGRTSVADTRSVHHHHHRGRSVVAGHCGYYGCVRFYPWGYYASARWFPGYYDYAPGQLGRGRPRYWVGGVPTGITRTETRRFPPPWTVEDFRLVLCCEGQQGAEAEEKYFILPNMGYSRALMLSLVRVALSFTFIVLVNASLGTRGKLGANTRTLRSAVKVNLTTVNETPRPILRCGCFREEYTANPANQ